MALSTRTPEAAGNKRKNLALTPLLLAAGEDKTRAAGRQLLAVVAGGNPERKALAVPQAWVVAAAVAAGGNWACLEVRDVVQIRQKSFQNVRSDIADRFVLQQILGANLFFT